MLTKSFRNPILGTLIGAFLANFIFWFVVNVIWVNPGYGNFFENVISSYTYPQGFSMGIGMPIFMAGLTAGLVYSFVKIRGALVDKKGMRTAAQTGLVLAYFPMSLFGMFGIMSLATLAI
jgi:hypothetical protein